MEQSNFKIEYVNMGEKTTICHLSDETGYEIVGVYIAKRDEKDELELRKSNAHEKAIKNLQYSREKRKQRNNSYQE